MSTKTFVATTLLASLTAFAAQVMAADNPSAVQATTPQVSTLTRAEVLADLQIYRESGLAFADLSENAGFDSARKAKAEAKYAQLRNSPYFVALVKRYSEGTERVDVAAVR